MRDPKLTFLIRCAYGAVWLALIWLMVRYVLVWLLPFLIALALAALLEPAGVLCRRRLHLRRGFTATVLSLVVLGTVAAGLVLLPVLSVAQGFFLSFSVGCFARALGRGGVYLALAAFGPRCLFVLPCTLLLTVQGLSAAARRRDGQKVRLTEGAYWRRVGLCGLILLIGAALELTFGPRLLQWVIARTL